MNPLDLFEESRLEPRPIVILRKAALVIIYSLLFGYGFVLFFRVIFDHPLLLMSSYKDDKSQIPDVIFTMGTNFMIKCRIANNDFSHATNCDQYLIQPTPTGNAYITLFISESDFYLYHPGQRSQNGSIIFDFYASDAATVNSTAIYTNIYDKNSNPFRDGADITTNISLAAQRLGGEGLHVYTLGKHQIGLYYYSRTIRKALKHPILAALGFELQYVDRPRLDTLWSSRERNMSTITNSDYFGTVQVSCNNFFVHTETEQRSYTLLALFGLLGGVWSTLRGLYNYLFETDQQQGAVYSWYSWWFRNQEPLYDTLES